MVRRIVPELSEGDPLSPPGRTGVGEAAEVCFKTLINTLRLAIRLWVISGTHTQGCARNAEKSLPKGTCKNTVTIRYDG